MTLEFWKAGWRPTFGWLFIVFFFMTGVTILAQVWVDEASINDVIGILITMLTMGGAIMGINGAGPSWEKVRGVAGPSLPLTETGAGAGGTIDPETGVPDPDVMPGFVYEEAQNPGASGPNAGATS